MIYLEGWEKDVKLQIIDFEFANIWLTVDTNAYAASEARNKASIKYPITCIGNE